MKKTLILFILVTHLSSGTALALTAQQEKMTACNGDASAQSLKGQARKDFMKSCLSASHLTPQQEKMKTCNQEASQQALKGDARKSFMKTCLSG